MNAVYGFTRMMLKFIKEGQPDYVAVAFDSSLETFRHKIFDQYKANRSEQPEEIRHQIPLIKEVVEAFNIPIFEVEGYEADDVLATLAKQAASREIEAVIVTGDKDMFQLVTDNIKVLNPHKDNLLYDEKTIRDRFGVGPERMCDLFAMVGDSIDNIPGVPGVGPKTAAALLQEYGSLEGVYEHVDEIKGPKRRENLREHKNNAFLSRELVTVVSDVPLRVDLKECELKGYNSKELIDLFKRFEFHSLINEVIETNQRTDADYSVIVDEGELDELLKKIRTSRSFSLDFETTSPDPMRAALVGIAIAVEPETAVYIPVGHSSEAFKANTDGSEADDLFDGPQIRQISPGTALRKMKSALEDESIKKTGQNIKYETVILARNTVRLQGVDFDTMVASYLLNPSKPTHNLDQIALEFLNYRKIPLETIMGKGSSQRTMDMVDVSRVAEYACEDADITLRLRNILEPMLNEKGLFDLFERVEIPLIEVLAKMELCGVRIDVEVLNELSSRLAAEMKDLEKEVYRLAGREFNINSPQQLGRVLFEEMKMPSGKKTKTGFSTDVAVLEKLAVEHELPRRMLEYRLLSKLKSTYVDALPNLVHPETGRIHTSFNQTVTATGRLSSSEPNLQNIPVRSEIGKEIRRAFIPADDRSLLLSADYSQIELRILAHLSRDEDLCRAFAENVDIHDQTSAKIFRVPIKDVTSEMRRKAKIANYGILYGISAAKLAGDLGIGLEEAKQFIENYFTLFPSIKDHINSTIEEARRLGYVTTILNRRRYIPDINSQNFGVRRFAERTAINTPIQGSAADMIKIAMIEIDKRLGAAGLNATMILQVHDELLFDVPADEADRVQSIVKEVMETAYPLSVPVVADVRTGRNWLEAHD